MNTMEHGGAMAVERVKRLVAEARSRTASSESPRPRDSSADATGGNASVALNREGGPGSSQQH
ncbi:hypothetical protein [Gluconobacter japonicus]|uniref:Uncharacterized protein n=1 Tax=Gluconobacter japonicus TaxID=376620 RepID=A0ABQ5WID7_GLUJA|nr:hypothetical protein [Gluconobacter japonicus]KXV30390.1 hypothetical protein AD938_00300 [Gluconobacter japonicus]GLQ59598.1 hypothetical protein GCM10010937_14010 [Gluconobacter japonicus]